MFDPGRRDDGVTVTIPLAVLARVDPAAFERQIPGLRSGSRRRADQVAAQDVAPQLRPGPRLRQGRAGPDRSARRRSSTGRQHESLPAALAAALTALTGVVIGPADFDLDKVPDHLRMTFSVVDEQGRAVGAGKDLSTLQSSLRSDSRQAVAKASGTVERTGLTAFPADGVERSVTNSVAGHRVTGYPALVDEGATVGLQVFTSAQDQGRAMRAGTRRLVVLGTPSPVAHLRRRSPVNSC